ncbi:transglutaminase domain-containing protein [Candidatus Peregrinibacteria bacterium]|nr:transglutaminase domain-containing protein [Candidatus Peregrinibacteria bacterium]
MHPEFDDELEDFDESHAPQGRSTFIRFLAAFLAVCLLLLSLEGYSILIHPEPDAPVALAEVQSFLPNNPNLPFGSHQADEVRQVLDEIRDPIKQVANFVASNACKSGDAVCQSRALFYFVRDRITYVPDPQFHDQLENPLVVLKTGGADCEDMAVLVSAFQMAIGNEARLVFVPGHAYAQVRIPHYKDQWLNLEATCKTCKFNDLPTDTQLQAKEFVEL